MKAGEIVKQKEMFLKLTERRTEFFQDLDKYWQQYSSFDTWQFWTNVFMLLIPLFIFYKVLDRKRAFEIGFYGFAVHTITSYLDIFGIRMGYWGYPYQISTYIAANVALDAALIPVSFMLIYQYTYKNKKKYYLTSLLGIGAFSFILKPILKSHGLFYMGEGFTYLHLSMYYLAGIGFATIVVMIFHAFQDKKI